VADTGAPPLANRDVLAMAAGRLAPGEPADLVALAPLGPGDPVDTIVRRASARHVRAVYQRGEPLLTDGVLRRIPDDPPDPAPDGPAPGAALAARLDPFVRTALATARPRMDAATRG
jgi:cytosine/adenosine deaminase-related metal-dependent hydrolase